MTESIKFTTVTADIASKTISVVDAKGNTVNVTIRDITAVPVAVEMADCPLLAPIPRDFVTGFTAGRDSYGADAALKTAKYVLHYRFYYAPVAQGVTMFQNFGGLVTACAVVYMYFANHTNIAGTTEFQVLDTPAFGGVVDGNGTAFHGCDLAFAVEQFTEV